MLTWEQNTRKKSEITFVTFAPKHSSQPRISKSTSSHTTKRTCRVNFVENCSHASTIWGHICIIIQIRSLYVMLTDVERSFIWGKDCGRIWRPMRIRRIMFVLTAIRDTFLRWGFGIFDDFLGKLGTLSNYVQLLETKLIFTYFKYLIKSNSLPYNFLERSQPTHFLNSSKIEIFLWGARMSW